MPEPDAYPAEPFYPLRRGVDHGPLGIALAISVALHASLLCIAPGGIGPAVLPFDPEPVELTVAIGSPGEAVDELRNSRGNDAPEVPQANALSRAEANATSPAPAPDVAEGQAGSAPEQVADVDSNDGEAAPDEFEVSAETSVVADTGNDGAATTEEPLDPVTESTPPVTVVAASPSPLPGKPFSETQQKMLAKKVNDWAETFQRKHAADDSLTWKHRGQQYTARFSSVPGGDETALDKLAIEISTDQAGNRLSTTVQLKRLAFSNFAQFVNRWDRNVQIHDDELDGRFHSNTAINLSYTRQASPRFLGKVTTSARRVNFGERRGVRRRSEIFMAGLETGVRSIQLPRDYVPLPETLSIADEQLQTFAEDTRITFNEDGSYHWVSTESGLFERRGHVRAPASYLIAEGKAELEIKGTVKGKVLVYSPERIVITGDLRYASETGNLTGDYIGVVSPKNVEIAPYDVIGPGDLRIEAAIYAGRRFRVRDYHRRNDGTLEIIGSLTAGSLSATEPRYATRIKFDPRLEERRPPGFPQTDRYEVESWDAVWTVDAVPVAVNP